MSRSALWKYASLALGIALAGVAATLPPQYQGLADVLFLAAGAVKGGALIRRPGDVKVL